MRDWLETYWPFLLVFGGLALAVGGIAYGVHSSVVEEEAEYKEWLSQCVQDRKHYECTAMWRAGTRHDSVTAVPVPIIISH